MSGKAGAVRARRIEGADGVGLHMVETGPADAPAILLLHGWSQHHLAFSKQLGGTLAREFRVAAIDLRGHGASDKPADATAYGSEAWAGDVAAAVAALAPARPVVVGWSMGGWVLADYLRHRGDGAIAGAVFSGATATRIGRFADPEMKARRAAVDAAIARMCSGDQGEALSATVDFLKALTAAPLSKRDLAFWTAFATFCPPHVRAACRARDEDWRPDLARVSVPGLVIQGQAERICLAPLAEELAATLPDARLVTIPGAGHAPFWETPDRFDTELAAFARSAHRTAAHEGACR